MTRKKGSPQEGLQRLSCQEETHEVESLAEVLVHEHLRDVLEQHRAALLAVAVPVLRGDLYVRWKSRVSRPSGVGPFFSNTKILKHLQLKNLANVSMTK